MPRNYHMSAACTCSLCSNALLHAGTSNGSPAGSYGQAMTPTQLFSSYTEIQERYSAEKMKNRQHEIVLEQVWVNPSNGPTICLDSHWVNLRKLNKNYEARHWHVVWRHTP